MTYLSEHCRPAQLFLVEFLGALLVGWIGQVWFEQLKVRLLSCTVRFLLLLELRGD